MEIKEALKILREEKDKPGTPGHMMYGLLETAHPVAREAIEYQYAQTLVGVTKMQEAITEALKTQEGRDKFLEESRRLSLKLRTSRAAAEAEEDDG